MVSRLSQTWIVLSNIAWMTGCAAVVTTIPSQASTDGRFAALERELTAFYETNGRFPAALAELPVVKGDPSHATDGWGHAMTYRHESDGNVVVQSLGRDGAPGGVGDDADQQIIVDAEAIELLMAARRAVE